MKVLHVPCYSHCDPLPVLEEHISELERYESIGLVTTSQHLNRLDAVKAYLQSKGKRVEVGGQILGCRHENALKLDVECLLYVGSGRFHPLGVAARTDKPIYVLNPLSEVLDRIGDDEKRVWLGRRKAAVKRALESSTYGIIVSTKEGQFDIDVALKLKESLESKGRRAFIFAGDELTPNNLLPFKVDCFVNTACPRLSGDEYHRSVVNAEELEDFLNYL